MDFNINLDTSIEEEKNRKWAHFLSDVRKPREERTIPAINKDTGNAKKARTFLSQHAVEKLETIFREKHYLEPVERIEIGNQLNLASNVIQVWFQNRRYKEKTKANQLAAVEQSRPHFAPQSTSTHCIIENSTPSYPNTTQNRYTEANTWMPMDEHQYPICSEISHLEHQWFPITPEHSSTSPQVQPQNQVFMDNEEMEVAFEWLASQKEYNMDEVQLIDSCGTAGATSVEYPLTIAPEHSPTSTQVLPQKQIFLDNEEMEVTFEWLASQNEYHMDEVHQINSCRTADATSVEYPSPITPPLMPHDLVYCPLSEMQASSGAQKGLQPHFCSKGQESVFQVNDSDETSLIQNQRAMIEELITFDIINHETIKDLESYFPTESLSGYSTERSDFAASNSSMNAVPEQEKRAKLEEELSMFIKFN